MPDPGPDEVLIEVAAAGVNPVDWKIREGYMKDSIKVEFPFALGWDVSGTIHKTGSQVARFTEGDTVFARADTSRDGAYAGYIVVRASEVAFAPDGLPLSVAAGIPLAAQTAWAGLFGQGNLRKGQSVLIHGSTPG